LFKTVDYLAETLMTRIAGLHSYEVPCVVVWPIDKLLGSYAEWVEGSVG
jgi:periplasmic divalent cation tolerance protein